MNTSDISPQTETGHMSTPTNINTHICQIYSQSGMKLRISKLKGLQCWIYTQMPGIYKIEW